MFICIWLWSGLSILLIYHFNSSMVLHYFNYSLFNFQHLKNTYYRKFPFFTLYFLKDFFTIPLCLFFPKQLNNLFVKNPFPQILLGFDWNYLKFIHYFSFIHSINIHWASTMYQALLYILGINEQVNEQVKRDHCSWGAYILVSGGSEEVGSKQVNIYRNKFR